MPRLATAVHPGRNGFARAARVAGFALALAATPAAAQPAASNLRPWLPPHADSVTVWAARARAEFRANLGDSVGGDNYLAYQEVAKIGRSMFASLGRANMRQAYAIEPAIRGLGLSVELRIDPAQPAFALLMVRNPYRLSAAAVGFVYWWRGEEVKSQGVYFRWGRDPRFRVWWTGKGESLYLCGIVDHAVDAHQTLGFLLLGLSHDASYWDLIQYPGAGPEIDAGGEADWEDVNGDGVPELVAWLRAPSDSVFSECTGCPGLFVERVFTLHNSRFELEDSRLVPTPYATFQIFIRMLGERNRAGAMRLLARPSMLDSALAEGWGADLHTGAWLLDRTEGGEQWPRWLSLRHDPGRGRAVYAVHFNPRDGRWVISHWYRERYFGPDSSLRSIYGSPTDSSSGRTATHKKPGDRTKGAASPPPGAPPKGIKP